MSTVDGGTNDEERGCTHADAGSVISGIRARQLVNRITVTALKRHNETLSHAGLSIHFHCQ